MPVKQPEKIDITFASFFRFFSIAILIAAVYFLLQVLAALLFAVVIASAIDTII